MVITVDEEGGLFSLGFLILSLFLGFLPRFDLLREDSADSEGGLVISWLVVEVEVGVEVGVEDWLSGTES